MFQELHKKRVGINLDSFFVELYRGGFILQAECDRLFKNGECFMTVQAQNDKAWFKSCLQNKELIKKIEKIKLVVSDVDGALTNAWVYITSEGEGGRYFSTVDGYIVKPALASGLLIAFVSGKDNKSTFMRGTRLGLSEDMCVSGTGNKVENVCNLQEKKSLKDNEVLIFGDDYLDAQVKLEKPDVLYACPSNTLFYLQSCADLVVTRDGGASAFRLLLDLILFVQKKHFVQKLLEREILT
jgi:3-deoxy-D-manno-octulosonate 8-phosphate phosphatase (KDO 8-P phosphatase)